MFRFLALLIVPALVALPAVAQDKGYSPFIAKAKSAVTKDFKDPDGARYRGLGVYKDNLGGTVLCGEVNGKNGFGAYVGYRRFFTTATNPPSATLREDGDDSLFDTLYKASCHTKLADAK